MAVSWGRLVSLLALSSGAIAQTYTSCNPTTNSSCPSDTGLSSSSYSVDFTQGEDSDNWTSVGTGSITYSSSGAAFIISKKGDAPTLDTNWYFFFGRAEVHMRAAGGTGIVSSVVLESDDLDEVDWEWIGGVADEVQTNYFGKGNTTSYDRGGKSAVSDSQGTTHNYTLDWTPDAITWYIDGVAVRTLAYADALGGKNFPQTPMRLKLGSWAGGDSDNAQGTIEWAGGETNYDDGPFTMYVESVKITNTYPGSSYTYGDQTGDWTSIVVDSSSSSSSGASSSGKNSTSTTTSSAKESSTAATNSSTTVKSSSTSTSAAATSSVTSVTAGSGTSPVTVNPFFVAIAGLTAFLLL